jgi:hypothetical protein
MGGFEGSTHVLKSSGRRLDMIAATRHDEFAASDYRRMMDAGLKVARDTIRWHVVEPRPGEYDFSSARTMVRAALATGIQVIWDLVHFGWPDHVDVFDPSFPERVAKFAHGFAEVLDEEGDPAPAVAPVNEISFLSFAGGEVGFFNPFAHGRGDAMKRQLVSASIAASRAVRAVLPGTRLIHTDPVIHVAARPDRPQDRAAAAAHEAAQFHAWDAIAGRVWPELGGAPELLDVLGVNYYVHNQWYYPGGHGSMISPSSPEYRPLHTLLLAPWERYHRPMFIAETGIEDEARPAWLEYVAHEARVARRLGAQLQGVCLYPIVNHPGWDDDRHCHNGLWDYANERGEREAYAPLLEEIRRQQDRMRRPADPAAEEDEALRALRSLDTIAASIAEATETSREG